MFSLCATLRIVGAPSHSGAAFHHRRGKRDWPSVCWWRLFSRWPFCQISVSCIIIIIINIIITLSITSLGLCFSFVFFVFFGAPTRNHLGHSNGTVFSLSAQPSVRMLSIIASPTETQRLFFGRRWSIHNVVPIRTHRSSSSVFRPHFSFDHSLTSPPVDQVVRDAFPSG